MPSAGVVASGLMLMSTTALAQTFTLTQDFFANGDFFSNFQFFETSQQNDPTSGTVQYLSQADAQNAGLISQNGNSVTMGVDSTNVQPNGRPATRIMSTSTFNSGLVIVDVAHMPGGICGTWPAFWMLGGGTWPAEGEIDIIEGVNSGSTNTMSLHTTQGCTISADDVNMSGSIASSDCWTQDPNQSSNQGCGITTSDSSTYGAGFNSNGGGVYATQIDDNSNAITIWFFPRSSIPADITNGTPDPTGWDQPIAQYIPPSDSCPLDQHFQNLAIIFNTDFCGDWAGQVWAQDPVCSAKANTCADYVINTPGDFADAYWTVNSLKVYSSGQGNAGVIGETSAAQFNSTAKNNYKRSPKPFLS